ncbi:hypothetical protein L596_004202 [Steinernema carpocapsae]|uniref:Cysteinyl-tRNA synthetase class Ia DALR domain-containing protein n=1 Tax=Steinernema carpocapsae TaxID=34508 RepID=A0A4U8UYK4_STECR|nr:hypothetical protein L596_004202 [Steinernema carpocapsae]
MTWLLKVFGYSDSEGECDKMELLMPYLQALSQFREGVRKSAIVSKEKAILKLCDDLRDEVLPELGVLLEDKDGQTSVKFVDPKELLRERELKKQAEAAKLAEKQKREKERQEKEAQKRVNPKDLFTKGPEAHLYSKFDERGVPTHMADGEEISEKKKKKLEKAYDLQKKNYEKAMAASASG